MARLQATAAQFKVAMQATMEATQRAIVETAKREHGKIMAADPRPGSFQRVVDGVKGAREEAVKPAGVIQYDYMRLDVVAQYAMEVLFDYSPVLSGLYRESHTLFLNDVAVQNLKDWQPGDNVVISNFVPYARVIERGMRGEKPVKVRLPPHVYERAERTVRRRYGNIAHTYFTYRGIVSGGIIRGKAGNQSEVRFPALIISELA